MLRRIFFPKPCAALFTLTAMSFHAAPSPALPPVSNGLQQIVEQSVSATLEPFANQQLKPDQLAVTVIDLRDPAQPVRGSYRGDVQIYPASVIKLFYLAAAHRWMEDNRLKDTAELRRAMRDMMVDSSNEATHYIVDLLTDTTSGPELSDAEIDAWFEKRNTVNRYFASLGYTDINANKKPWCEGPYGRDTQSMKRHKPGRNMLTTDATARLMTEIVLGQAVSTNRSTQMMELMKRVPSLKNGDTDNQMAGYIGAALPPGSKLWSKVGGTSEMRHDAGYAEFPDGTKFVVVVFTIGHAEDRSIIPAVVRNITARLSVAN